MSRSDRDVEMENPFAGYLAMLEKQDKGHARGIYMRDTGLARLGRAIPRWRLYGGRPTNAVTRSATRACARASSAA